MKKLSKNTKIDLLKHFQNRACEEINVFRERQEEVFKWSSNIFLLVIGALLVIDQSESITWSTQGYPGKIIASFAILVLIIFSIRWHQRLRYWQEESTEVQNSIEKLLHCFDKGYYGTENEVALYPERWAKPKEYKHRVRLIKRIFRVNFISGTILLGILSIMMVWIAS